MKKSFWIILFLVLGSIAVGAYLYFKPVPGLDRSTAEFSMDATSLYKAFEQDEDQANKTYLDHIIEVSGIITQVDNQKIQLSTNSVFGVICEMEPNSNNANLNIGDEITLRGLCTGKLMDVILTRCIVINE